nr:hypothetical protein BaRGS_024807 [Batillaria attramentaria]
MAGNILSIVVFLTTSLRHSPTAIYMVTLAALDCVISFYAGLQLFLLVFLGEERFFAESWHCRAYYFTFLFVIHFNTLTLVFMTAQRYVAVNFPLQAARWCTRRGAVFTLVVAGAVSLLANFVHLVTFRLNPDWDGSYRGRCSIGDGLGAYIQMRVFPWVDSVLYFFLPTVSIGALNVLIFISLRKAERFKRQAGISGFEHQQENGLAPQQEQASTTTTITPLPAIKVDAQNIPDGADADLGPVCSQRVRVVPHETMEANGAVLTLPAGIFVVLFRYWNPPAGHPKAQFSLVRAVAE